MTEIKLEVGGPISDERYAELIGAERPEPEIIMMMTDDGKFLVSKDGGVTMEQYISYEEASWMEEERFTLYRRRVILNFFKLLLALLILFGISLTAFALFL
jgi:hypothetical protein